MVQCVINRLLSCPCDVVFVSGALRWVAAKKVTTPSGRKKLPYAVAHLGGRSGRWRTFETGDGCETACTGTHDTQCVHVPCVLECVI